MVDQKKFEEGLKTMPKFLIVVCIIMWYICHHDCIAGHSLGTLLYPKTKNLNTIHLRSFLQLLQKVQVSG